MGGRTGRRANPANLCKCQGFALYKKKELILGATPKSQERHTREGCGALDEELHKAGLCVRSFCGYCL